MKFAKHQANNLIPEWRMKYLDVFYISPSYADRKQYKKGKKLLKEVKKARLRQRPSSFPAPLLPNGNEINGEYGRNTPRSSFYSSKNKHEKGPGQLSPNLKPPKFRSESTGSGGVPTVDRVQGRMTPDPTGPYMDNVQLTGRKSLAVNFNQLQANLRQVRDTIPPPRYKPTVEIELESLTAEQMDTFNGAELNFLSWLDAEIEKIDDFYREKEKVAAERYKNISAQLEALRQLGYNHIANESSKLSQGISTPELVGHDDRSGVRLTWRTLIHQLRASFDRLSSVMPAADHDRRVEQPELMARPITTKTGYVEYRVARRRLKQAILEFYRSMELLKEYRLLNRTGLEKMLKKFDKTARRKISGEYAGKFKSMHFEQSDELENLISRTEVRDHFRILVNIRIYMLGTLKRTIGKMLLRDYVQEKTRMNKFRLYSTSVFSSASRSPSFSRGSCFLGNL